jgi:hypothetical protein
MSALRERHLCGAATGGHCNDLARPFIPPKVDGLRSQAVIVEKLS